MATKFTKRDKFTALIGIIERVAPDMDSTPEGINPEDWLETLAQFCVSEIALLDRKHNAGPNPKREVENTTVRANIYDVMEGAAESMTATEIANAAGYTVQRVSAHLRQMPMVVREQDGKRVKFHLA